MIRREETRASSATLVVLRVGAAVAILGGAGCVKLDTGHCLANGGDLACGGDLCVLDVAGGRAPGDAGDGCASQVPAGFVHLEYGLPATEGRAGDGRDTLAGVLEEVVGCLDVEDAVATVEDEWVPVGEIRRRLADGPRVRKSALDLSQGEVDAIERFNRAIGELRGECPASTSDDATTTGSDAGGTDTGSDETTTGEQPACRNDADCEGSDDGPFCDEVAHTCTTCEGQGDDFCGSRDADAPVCHDGDCVQCTDDDLSACGAPLCDAETNTCLPCTEHAQCSVGDQRVACNLFTGECLPDDAVANVGMGRFLRVDEAVSSLGNQGTVVVHNVAGLFYDDQPVVVSSGQTIAFLGDGLPRWTRSVDGNPQVRVEGDGTVLADGVQLVADFGSAPAIDVDGGRAWIDRAWVSNNNGGGIRILGSDAWNETNELILRNSFVKGAGDSNALDIHLDASVELIYSSFGGGSGASTAISCDATGMSSLSLRGCLVVSLSNAPELSPDCSNVMASYTASESGLPGEGNPDLPDPMPAGGGNSWFVNYSSGNLHLSANAPPGLMIEAPWGPVLPTSDIDGDPRVGNDYAGADVP